MTQSQALPFLSRLSIAIGSFFALLGDGGLAARVQALRSGAPLASEVPPPAPMQTPVQAPPPAPVKAEAKPEPKQEAKQEATAAVKKVDVDAELKAKAKAEADARAKAEARAEAKAEAKAKAEADAKARAAKLAKAEKAEKADKTPDDSQRAVALLEGKTVDKKAADTGNQKFVVQVAALGSQEKVDELQEKLNAAGIRAHTHKVSTPSGDRIQVRVGPFSREEADKMRARLDKVGLGGSMVRPDGK